MFGNEEYEGIFDNIIVYSRKLKFYEYDVNIGSN